MITYLFLLLLIIVAMQRDFLFFFFSFIFLLLVYGVVGGIASARFMKETHRDDIKLPIYSFANSSGFKGEFTLGLFTGLGQMGTYEEYRYYFMNDKGALQLGKTPVNLAQIYLRDEPPYLFRQVVHYRYPKWFCAPPFDFARETRETTTDFIIPNGSLIQKYELR